MKIATQRWACHLLKALLLRIFDSIVDVVDEEKIEDVDETVLISFVYCFDHIVKDRINFEAQRIQMTFSNSIESNEINQSC